jgi:hypothetical protein
LPTIAIPGTALLADAVPSIPYFQPATGLHAIAIAISDHTRETGAHTCDCVEILIGFAFGCVGDAGTASTVANVAEDAGTAAFVGVENFEGVGVAGYALVDGGLVVGGRAQAIAVASVDG